MCKIIDDIIERECKEVEKKASIDTARRLLKMKTLSVEEIAIATALSVEDVEKLIKERSA